MSSRLHSNVEYRGFNAHAHRHATIVLLAAITLAAIASTAFVLVLGATLAFAGTCPNEAFRTGPSASLPDCRAYELTTPVNKNGISLGGTGVASAADQESKSGLVASEDGQQILFPTFFPIGDSVTSTSDVLLSTRTSQGWRSASAAPPESAFTNTPDFNPNVKLMASSSDRSELLLSTTGSLGSAPTSGQKLYLRNSDGTFTFTGSDNPGVNEGGSAPTNPGAGFAGSNSDLSNILFTSSERLLATDTAPAGAGELFDWEGAENGHLMLVGFLPDGSLDPNGVTSATTWYFSRHDAAAGVFGDNAANGVSSDGSKVFFYSQTGAGSGPEQLYVRENDQTTVEVSRSQKTNGSDPNGPQAPVFMGATPDGEHVFFVSKQELTNDANTAGDTSNNLYEYDLESGHLTDISASDDPAGAQVEGLFNGGIEGFAHEDTSVNFSDNGQLVYFFARGQIGGQGVEGQPNLYVSDHGQVQYIGTGMIENASDIALSPDGSHLLFERGGKVYEYSANSSQLACVTCGLPGAPISSFVSLHVFDDGSYYIFFETPDALVPQDTNGVTDVYEYHDGQLGLISSGTSEYGSYLDGATPSGSDVYFSTSESLVAQDDDNGERDIYDARIDGGFPVPTSPPRCSGEACQGPLGSAPSLPLTGGSASTGGGGNLPSPAAPKPTTKPKPSSVTRAQKLADALKACKRKPKHKRSACVKKARNKYGSTSKAKRQAEKTDRRGGIHGQAGRS